MNTAAVETGDALPSLELLEFLVEWETGDGTWIDPVELEGASWPDPGQADTEQDDE